jgi:hypothetical protein
MYLYNTHTGDDAKRAAASTPPFGPGFSEDVVKQTTKLEVWSSSMNDAGPDFNEFRAFDEAGKTVGTQRLTGH